MHKLLYIMENPPINVITWEICTPEENPIVLVHSGAMKLFEYHLISSQENGSQSASTSDQSSTSRP